MSPRTSEEKRQPETEEQNAHSSRLEPREIIRSTRELLTTIGQTEEHLKQRKVEPTDSVGVMEKTLAPPSPTLDADFHVEIGEH